MEITTDELLKLLGAKEVENYLLKKQVVALKEIIEQKQPDIGPDAFIKTNL